VRCGTPVGREVKVTDLCLRMFGAYNRVVVEMAREIDALQAAAGRRRVALRPRSRRRQVA